MDFQIDYDSERRLMKIAKSIEKTVARPKKGSGSVSTADGEDLWVTYHEKVKSATEIKANPYIYAIRDGKLLKVTFGYVDFTTLAAEIVQEYKMMR